MNKIMSEWVDATVCVIVTIKIIRDRVYHKSCVTETRKCSGRRA